MIFVSLLSKHHIGYYTCTFDLSPLFCFLCPLFCISKVNLNFFSPNLCHIPTINSFVILTVRHSDSRLSPRFVVLFHVHAHPFTNQPSTPCCSPTLSQPIAPEECNEEVYVNGSNQTIRKGVTIILPSWNFVKIRNNKYVFLNFETFWKMKPNCGTK